MIVTVDPKNDYAFKVVYGREQHVRVLVHLLLLLETAGHFPFNDHFDLHLFQLPCFTKTVDELVTDLDLWLYVLNNGKGLDLDNLPLKLRVAEIIEALEA